MKRISRGFVVIAFATALVSPAAAHAGTASTIAAPFDSRSGHLVCPHKIKVVSGTTAADYHPKFSVRHVLASGGRLHNGPVWSEDGHHVTIFDHPGGSWFVYVKFGTIESADATCVA